MSKYGFFIMLAILYYYDLTMLANIMLISMLIDKVFFNKELNK